MRAQTRELSPRIEPSAVPGVAGLEVWHGYDWYGPKVYVDSNLLLTAPLGEAVTGVTYRYRGQPRAMSVGMLIIPPGHVSHVDLAGCASPEAVLVGVVVTPAAVLTGLELRQLGSRSLDLGFGTQEWGNAVRSLVQHLQSSDMLACEKQELVRAFVRRALLERLSLSEATAAGCARAVKLACDYVHSNAQGRFSLDEVARAAQVTKWHLARTFRRQLGISIGSYARQVRAHCALQQLRGGAPLSLVAGAAGYSDQSHLTREFRRIFGFTPGKYAQAHAARSVRWRAAAAR